MKTTHFCLGIALATFLYGCSSSETKTTSSVYQTRFVPVADSVKLEVLDWGGNGQPFLFLGGLGTTAHSFCDFAPRFTDHYHVYGITRRGVGQSSIPKTGYDSRTLAHDIRVVLDSLRIKKAILAGHSMGGSELSRLASLYPDRVGKLVYLDAAYDYGEEAQLGDFPDSPRPTAKDSASLTNYQQFIKATYGTLIPLEEMKQTCRVAPNGRYVGDKVPGFVYKAIIDGAGHPDYAHIACPALAIYAEHTSASEELSFYNKLDSANRRKADGYYSRLKSWQRIEMDQFKKEVPGGIVKAIKGAEHALFISHPAETEKLIRDFLK